MQSILYARNIGSMEIPEGLSVPWADTLCKRALEEGRTFTDDVASCWGDSEAARALGISTYVTTPVLMADGSMFGTLCAASTDRKPINEEGRQVLSLFGSLIGQHIQREHLLEKLQDANRQLEAFSFTDPLTGLPNRRFILQELRRLFGLAQREGRKVMIAFIDLDGFKAINDTYGHETGDEFLVEIGQRLTRGMRSSDLLARLGGDEFVLVGLGPVIDQGTRRVTGAMRRRLAPLIEGRFVLGSCTIDYPGASFGIILADPHLTTPEQSLQQADAAMYVDKKMRRDRANSASHAA